MLLMFRCCGDYCCTRERRLADEQRKPSKVAENDATASSLSGTHGIRTDRWCVLRYNEIGSEKVNHGNPYLLAVLRTAVDIHEFSKLPFVDNAPDYCNLKVFYCVTDG